MQYLLTGKGKDLWWRYANSASGISLRPRPIGSDDAVILKVPETE